MAIVHATLRDGVVKSAYVEVQGEKTFTDNTMARAWLAQKGFHLLSVVTDSGEETWGKEIL